MSMMRLRVARIAEVIARAPVDAATWLSPSERERGAQLQVPARRDQFLSGRWLTRELLAEHAGGHAIDWTLQERRSLPPAVVGPAFMPLLSLSHSGDWIAVAIADRPIGIDLEQRRPREALHRFESLLRATDDVEGELDTDTLLQRWVTKEAWIKRDHGSALPERLAAVFLQRAVGNEADVQLLSTAAFHLGIATTAVPWNLDLPEPVRACEGWRVRDLDPI